VQGYLLRPATAADAGAVAELVDDAYRPYVERIGMRPGPMTEDYREVIRDRQVTVAESEEALVGVLVLGVTADGFLIHNVAVHPSHRGKGLGRALLELAEAEARRAGSTRSTSTRTRGSWRAVRSGLKDGPGSGAA
jgi:GNAT superfamily N-acetyltransferase